jgi:hypothetical protein
VLSRKQARLSATLLCALLTLTGTAATASPSDVPRSNVLALLPAAVHSALSQLDRRIQSERQALGSGSFETAVEAMMRLDHAPHPSASGAETSTSAIISSSRLETPGSLPKELRVPVAGLAAAARHAFDLLGGRLSSRELQRRSQGTLVHQSTLFPDLPGDGMRLVSSRSAPYRSEATGEAALILAHAFDRFIPALEAHSAAHAQSVDGSVSGCDLLDRLPFLCVGSAANNTYDQNAVLLVDLGGNDTYLNSSGGAPFLLPDGSASSPLSVNIDLSNGADAYSSTVNDDSRCMKSPSLPWLNPCSVQGAAGAGGVGILIDDGGGDSYSVGVSAKAGKSAGVMAQGAANEGLGLLFDLGGSDRYSMTASDGSLNSIAMVGQGDGSVGLAALVDLGKGDDTYSINGGTLTVPESVDVENLPPSLGRFVQGQGWGDLGAGVLLDDGGTDVFEMFAAAETGQRLEWPGSAGLHRPPHLWLAGQGYREGLLLEGDGDTSYSMRATTNGISDSIVSGQGGFQGVLDDQGGDDSYLLESKQDLVVDRQVDSSCVDPDGNPCSSATLTVALFQEFGTLNVVAGQGAQSLFGNYGDGGQGIALLSDSAGNDRYSAIAETSVTVALHDHLESPSAPPALTVKGGWGSWLVAQGYTWGFNGLSAGILLDRAGTDSYLFRVSDPVTASATTDHAAGEPVVVAVATGRLGENAGQGAVGNPSPDTSNTGALLDLGGSGDSFLVESEARASASPDPLGAWTNSAAWPRVQGAGSASNGKALFVALGDDPVILSHPSRPVCQPSVPGARGWGLWSDPCGYLDRPDESNVVYGNSESGLLPGIATGYAPNATGSPSTIAFTADTARETAWGGRVSAIARLTDANGDPIVGATVRFTIGFITQPPALPIYRQDSMLLWEAVGVTDTQGIARTSLPVQWPPGLDWNPASRAVLEATYDGAPHVYPAHDQESLLVR